MKKEDFLYLLYGVSYATFKFAEKFITDKLPTDFRYDVHLNVSYDDNSLPQFESYPEDNTKIFEQLTDKEVVELLCRKEKVPVWIDISIDKINKEFTTFKLLCAERYSNDNKEFNYYPNGSGPFGIKSPNLPVDYKEGKKFKL